MPAPGVLQSEYAINGSFGELYDENGDFIAQCQRVEFGLRINRRDINRAGSRAMAYKAMTVGMEGNINALKVSSYFLQIVSEMVRSPRQLQRQLMLRVKIDDPEAIGPEEYRLKKVKIWEVNGGWSVNDILEENIPFTFEDFEPISWIDSNPQALLASQHAARYTSLD